MKFLASNPKTGTSKSHPKTNGYSQALIITHGLSDAVQHQGTSMHLALLASPKRRRLTLAQSPIPEIS